MFKILSNLINLYFEINIFNVDRYSHTAFFQVQFCCEECLYAANESYHELLCIGENRNDPEHPINVLEEEWK